MAEMLMSPVLHIKESWERESETRSKCEMKRDGAVRDITPLLASEVVRQLYSRDAQKSLLNCGCPMYTLQSSPSRQRS